MLRVKIYKTINKQMCPALAPRVAHNVCTTPTPDVVSSASRLAQYLQDINHSTNSFSDDMATLGTIPLSLNSARGRSHSVWADLAGNVTFWEELHSRAHFVYFHINRTTSVCSLRRLRTSRLGQERMQFLVGHLFVF